MAICEHFMLIKVFSYALIGLEGALVEVEVDIAQSTTYNIVGTKHHL